MPFPDNNFEGVAYQDVPQATTTSWGEMFYTLYPKAYGKFDEVALPGGSPVSTTSQLGGASVIKDLTQGPVYQSCYYYIPSTPTLTLIGGALNCGFLENGGYGVYNFRQTIGLHLRTTRRLQWGNWIEYLNPSSPASDVWQNDAGGSAVSPQLPIGWCRIDAYIRNSNGPAPTINIFTGSNLHSTIPTMSWNAGHTVTGADFGIPSETVDQGLYFYYRYRSMYANSEQGDVSANVVADMGRMSFTENPGPHPNYLTSPFDSNPAIAYVSVNGESQSPFYPMSNTRYAEINATKQDQDRAATIALSRGGVLVEDSAIIEKEPNVTHTAVVTTKLGNFSGAPFAPNVSGFGEGGFGETPFGGA